MELKHSIEVFKRSFLLISRWFQSLSCYFFRWSNTKPKKNRSRAFFVNLRSTKTNLTFGWILWHQKSINITHLDWRISVVPLGKIEKSISENLGHLGDGLHHNCRKIHPLWNLERGWGWWMSPFFNITNWDWWNHHLRSTFVNIRLPTPKKCYMTYSTPCWTPQEKSETVAQNN